MIYVLKKWRLQILTISLQINFYQIYFIQWFYKNGRSKDKIYVIQPTILNLILLEYEISILAKGRHGLVIFSRTQIKFT